MPQLKDKNNQDVMPNTTAANVSYGNTNVAARIAELEQGGGIAPAPSDANLFNPSTELAGKGVLYHNDNNGIYGGIGSHVYYGCVFVPLRFGKKYIMSGYDWISGGGIMHAQIVALAKGTQSDFTNLQVDDFVDGSTWLSTDKRFTHGTNIYIEDARPALYFATPESSELNDVTSIGLVINVTFNKKTPCNDTLKVMEVESNQSLIGRTAAFFGASITEGTDGGYVNRTAELLQLGHVYNFGSSGADTTRIWKIMLGEDSYPEKDYGGFDVVVVKDGGNDRYKQASQFGNIDADIPDIGIYDIQSFPYEYSASEKTITSATVNNAKEFFTKCFAKTFYGYMASYIEYVRFINPNCRIFHQTEPHSVGIYTDFALLREAIYAIAIKMGVQVIDGGAYAGLGLWNMSYWCRDTGASKIHFNAKGNEMWAAYLANELDKKFYETEL